MAKKVYIFAERVNFSACFRKDNEAITAYINRLHSLAGDCSFGTSLDERLRDQLIFGINNRDWQEQIIQKHSENTAKLSDVEATALLLEQASIQTTQLTNLQSSVQKSELVNVNRVNKKSKKPIASTSFNEHNKTRELHPDTDWCKSEEYRHVIRSWFSTCCYRQGNVEKNW